MVYQTSCTTTTTKTTTSDHHHCSLLEQPTTSLLEGASMCTHHSPEDDTGHSASAKSATTIPQKFPLKIEHSTNTIRSSSAGDGLASATLVCHGSSSGLLDVNKNIASQQEETTFDRLSSNGDEPLEDILHDMGTSETTNLVPQHEASPSSSLLLLCELEKYRNGPLQNKNPKEEVCRQVPVTVQIHRPRTLVSQFNMLRITENDYEPKRKSQVSFHQVTIRRYPMIAGDNPACEYGPPVTLDWGFEELPSLDLDDFESMRRRTRRQKLHHLLLSYMQRQRILVGTGYTEQQIKQVEKEARTARFQRNMTRLLLPISKVEEMIQSLSRKIQRRWKATERQSKLEFNAILLQLREDDAKRLSQPSYASSTRQPS